MLGGCVGRRDVRGTILIGPLPPSRSMRIYAALGYGNDVGFKPACKLCKLMCNKIEALRRQGKRSALEYRLRISLACCIAACLITMYINIW